MTICTLLRKIVGGHRNIVRALGGYGVPDTIYNNKERIRNMGIKINNLTVTFKNGAEKTTLM